MAHSIMSKIIKNRNFTYDHPWLTKGYTHGQFLNDFYKVCSFKNNFGDEKLKGNLLFSDFEEAEEKGGRAVRLRAEVGILLSQ